VSATDHLHDIRGSASDLQCFARLWEWERVVRESVSLVLETHITYTVFQPVFRLDSGSPELCGHEAFTRFPTAPRIPVGLWFRTAHEIGLGDRLERLAASTAVDSCRSCEAGGFLNVNASLATAVDIVIDVRPRLESQLVVDVPCSSVLDRGFESVVDRLRDSGASVSLDDTPLDRLHDLRPRIEALKPDFLKVDVVAGLFDDAMGRFNLAEAAAWCRDSGIDMVAERVELQRDLDRLYDLGVAMAQGYSLARPARPTA
jgi:EAL domain-containing protein (putative c-di-GMP-specific phosphodiesterase class I)